MHAAVIAINDAIDHGVPEGTMGAMRNPNAMLNNLDEAAAQHYQDTLSQAKALKVENARKRVSGVPVGCSLDIPPGDGGGNGDGGDWNGDGGGCSGDGGDWNSDGGGVVMVVEVLDGGLGAPHRYPRLDGDCCGGGGVVL